MADHMQQLLANVEALVSGQARIELCLDGLASEQRLHGDRLLGLEKKVSQITDKRLSQNSDKATSHNKAAKEDDSSTRSPLASPMPSPMPRKASALSFDIGSDDGVKMVSWMTGTGSMQWEENDDGLLPPASVAGEAPTLAADWPHCIPCRKFGLLPESPDSAIAKLPTQTLMERMTLKVTSAQPQEGKTSFQSRFGSCILEPSSKKRIVFDLCAMVFLLYDLCVTPVAIAWDFPMKGWLLYCTTFVATFWTVDIVVTMRTGFYQQGTLVVKPGLILKRYFRTTMLPDLLIVLVDWLTVFANAIFPEEQSDNPELIGAKLVRFSKATRVVRIVSVTRVVRILEYLEHIGDRLHGGSSLKYVGDMARLIVIIIWINHVMSCTWFYVGRVTEGDTGTSWLMDPIRDENSPLYSEALPLFQYTTAFHWAITQMTPGSMQVFPRNSLERMFNIFALIFGMIFFSSLISSLSATMVNFRMKSTQTANQMSELRRFLRQAKISNKLSMGVQKQALERLMEVKPLTVTDVTALKILSSDLRMELQHELCHPYVMRSGFYRVCQHADPAALKSLMYECITFTFFSAGDTIFEAGEVAVGAFFVETGSLQYIQNTKTSRVRRKVRVNTHHEIIVAEAALWTHWKHVGTLSSPNPSSLLKINVEKHEKILRHTELMADFAAEFAFHYRTRLAAAKPPQSNWASDVEVQQTSFDEIIVCASRPTRFMMSTVALELLKGQASGWPRTIDFSMLGKAPKNLEDLELEVTKDKCTLITTSSGEVERLAAVSAIAISRTNGTTLMQLGSWDPEQGELKVGCKLPGTKQEAGETAVEAMQRLLKKDLLAFSEQIDLQQAIAKHELEWSRSEKYNLRTKYLRTIFQLTVDDDDDWPELQRLQSYDKDGVPGKARISARRSRMLPGSFGADDDDIEPCIADFAEVIGLPDGDGQRLLICGWLRDEDAERFKGEGDGKVFLQKAMARIHIDELILSSVKERLACCQLPPSGEMVLSEGDRFSSLTVVPQQS